MTTLAGDFLHVVGVLHAAVKFGHYRRYAIAAAKITAALGWRAAHTFDTGVEQTVRWYVANAAWCDVIRSTRYSGERLGLGVEAGG